MAITLYTGLGSGNSYKIDLMLRLLSLPYDAKEVSVVRNEHKDPGFLEITSFGQIPVLVDGDQTFTDSQAILCYLARKYGGADADLWLPTEALQLARVMRWLSVAANEIQNGLTMARVALLLKWDIDYEKVVEKSYNLLELMNQHLSNRDWLATDHVTVADVACYPYLYLAAEGGVDTSPFKSVTAWMERFGNIPNFWPIPRIPNLPEVPLIPPRM